MNAITAWQAWRCTWMQVRAWALQMALVMPLLCLYAPTWAARWDQLADTVFQHLTPDNGLPQGTGTALVEDKNGFLWIGTQGGLARWDGYRFHTYLSNPYDPYSLPEGFVSCLFVDRAGQLWVGTNGGGLARYVREEDRFQVIGAGKHGLSHVYVTAMIGDNEGGIWVGTDGGVDHLDANHHILPKPAWASLLPDQRVRSLLRSKDGILWVGTRSGLLRVDEHGQVRLIHFPVPEGNNLTIMALHQMSDGKIWIGVSDQGLFYLDAAEQLHRVPALEQDSHLSVTALAEVGPGQIWAGTNGAGILALDGSDFQLRRIRNDARLPASLADNTIWALLADHAGMMWVGTNRGLSYHSTRQKAVFSLFGVVGRTDGLNDSDVQAILAGHDGRIWLNLGSRTVAILDPGSGKIKNLTPQFNNVFGMSAAPDGRVYIGTDDGLYRGGGADQQLVQLPLPLTNAGGLPDIRRASVLEGGSVLLAEQTGIWVGGSNGLWRLALSADGKIVSWQAEAAGQLTDNRVGVIERSPDGKLWVGTDFGLNLVNTDTHEVEKIVPDRIDRTALASGSITSVLVDRQHRVWVATSGGGVNLLTGRNKAGRALFRRFGLEHGLPHMIVSKLLQDSQGNIWGSTEDGLFRIDGTTLQIQALRRADGIAISSYWAGGGDITRNDEVMFGGAGGMTILDLKKLGHTQMLPRVVVSDLRIGGKAQPLDLYNGPNPATLVLTPDSNNLALEFSALDYAAPERSHYAYQLAGYDPGWIETDASRRVATWANLPPGEYRLLFRSALQQEPRELQVKVLPAWYQTWWWDVLLAFASLVLIGALVQVRTHYLRRRQLELKSQVRIRTNELRQKQSELVHANEELAQTADTLRLMGDVGRDITANLEQDAVYEALMHHVAGLLDVVAMTIYLKNDESHTLDCCFAREDGKDQPHPRIPLNSPTSVAARAVRERHDVLIEVPEDSSAPSHVPGTLVLRTALFAPLIVGQRVLGAMSVQSERAHAYGERERLIFRTVCAYGAIALSNSEALDALHAAQRQLMQQEKMASLGGLVSGVAHEVNTPLGNTLMAISGVIGIWQQQKQLLASPAPGLAALQQYVDEGLEYAELAHLTALRAVEMVNSFKAIATYSDIDQQHDVAMEQYLPEVVALVRGALEYNGRHIHLDIEPQLVVRLVPEALTEALARILSNVLSHAFEGRQGGDVWVRAHHDGDNTVLIEVQDNGNGIAASDLPKVFDPFFTTKSGVGGHVGLGLHIAYNHVTQRLFGRIDVTSIQGQGTTVSIRLPTGTEPA